jgi:hypothetical protein
MKPRQRTQRAIVEEMLQRVGSVSQGELIYQHGITRAASIIHALRKDGWPIRTVTSERGTAVYVLERPDPKQEQLPW